MSTDTATPGINWLETRTSRWDDLVAFAGDQGLRVTPETAMKCSAYFACARVVAETVASLPLHLYRKLDDDTSERAKDLPLYMTLAKRPNSWQTRYEWVETMCLHLGFYGSAYNLKVPGVRGSVTELHPLHPSGMEVRQEDDKSLVYLYREPGTGRQVLYRGDQIMHVRWLSFDGVNGAVPVEIGKDAISLARSLEKYASTFYANNAQPGIVLHTDQALPREVREQLREQWNSRHRGAGRAGETAILSNGLKVDTVSATNQESQLAELWMQALLAVCRIWKMPPHMIQELGRATWGNLASEMVSFEKFTIQPWLRRIEGAIERDILPQDDDTLYAEFLVEGLLRSDITTRYQAYEIAVRNGWMTREEIRRKENLGPMPDESSDSPGEVEDTKGDAAEDVSEGEDDTPDVPPEDGNNENTRFDPNQPRNPDGTWGSGGGGGGSGDGPSGFGSSGGSDSGDAGKQGDPSPSTARKERLRDRIEGTQAEADREVVKADRKVRDIERKIAAVKSEMAGGAVAAAQAKVAAAERAVSDVRARSADLRSQLAASKARMAELKARLKRAVDELEKELEQESDATDKIYKALRLLNDEADRILASLS
jgi:HK97 family phage portal protein